MLKVVNKKRLIICLVGILLFIGCAVALTVLTPANSSDNISDEIAIYTRNKPYAHLSIAVINDGSTNIYVYGHDGRKLKNNDTQYELGQLTQIFTGAIAARAVLKGDLMLNQSIGSVLPVPVSSYTPSVRELITHSSAYSSYVPRGLGNIKNPYSDFSDFDLLMAMADFNTDSNPPYIYSSSDFGVAVLGTALGDLYNQSPYTVLNDFVHLELGLRNTFVGTSSDKAKHAYPWKVNDAYITSLGLTSTIDDMASYVKMHLNGDIDYLNAATTAIKEVNEDKNVGFFWSISKKSNIISYSGETSHYASCIYMDKENGSAVVVLSNYPNDKYGSVESIAADIIGGRYGQF